MKLAKVYQTSKESYKAEIFEYVLLNDQKFICEISTCNFEFKLYKGVYPSISNIKKMAVDIYGSFNEFKFYPIVYHKL